jgi:hypothetical protein
MMPIPWKASRTGRLLLGLLFLVLALCFSDRILGDGNLGQAADIDTTPRRIALISPGTVIGDRAPKGWTNLVIRSHPRVGPESQNKVSQSTARYASLLFTAIVADVQPVAGQPRGDVKYTLAGMAAGLGVKIKGQNTIISSDTESKLGADLGWIEAQVLSGAEKQLQQMTCVARSRTMAILDTPSTMLLNKKHAKVTLRYALLVDPLTGRLDTFLWAMDQEESAGRHELLGPMQLLAPNKVEDCVLHVDPDEFFLGIPSNQAFAMERLPQGRAAIEFSKELQSIASQAEFSAASTQTLDLEMRRLLSQAESVAKKVAP